MRFVLVLLVLAALCACGRDNVKPDLPGDAHAVDPQLQIVERVVYVAISEELTRSEPIAEGPIAQCFDVAAQRRAALKRANAKLRQIAEVQGTEVEP